MKQNDTVKNDNVGYDVLIYIREKFRDLLGMFMKSKERKMKER